MPIILQDQLKKLYSRVSKQEVMDYITRYATRHKYNFVLNAIKAVKWDGKDRVGQIYDIFKIPTDTEEAVLSFSNGLNNAFVDCSMTLKIRSR